MTKKTKSRKKKLHLQWVDETFEVPVRRRCFTDTRFLRKYPAAISPEQQQPLTLPLP